MVELNVKNKLPYISDITSCAIGMDTVSIMICLQGCDNVYEIQCL